jgi:hypothetical protein
MPRRALHDPVSPSLLRRCRVCRVLERRFGSGRLGAVVAVDIDYGNREPAQNPCFRAHSRAQPHIIIRFSIAYLIVTRTCHSVGVGPAGPMATREAMSKSAYNTTTVRP